MSDWIKCTQRKPDHEQWCLIPIPNGIVLSANFRLAVNYLLRDGGMWSFGERFLTDDQDDGYDGVYGIDHISHWMPLPNPPEAT